MDAFWHSTFFIAAAEMGDKSQLVALAYATRYSWKTALGGVAAATLLVHLGSVLLGEALGAALPTFWIKLAAGLAFIGFGAWTIRGDTYDPSQADQKTPRFGPFLTVAGTFFISELGDKTMLATVTLAVQLSALVAVWLGSTLGMVAADAVAIVVGQVMGKRLPERAIKLTAAAVFVGFGAWTIAEAFGLAA
ncbi:MAG TPA: TMEM165/GDT1 family protein [Chloroflexota bacterium]|nr:TMEM165/GDT1 family protein [Chloroflexota bacterium]